MYANKTPLDSRNSKQKPLPAYARGEGLNVS